MFWLVVSTNPSEKYDFVSWDDEFPNSLGNHKIHVPNHQSVMELIAIISSFSVVFPNHQPVFDHFWIEIPT